MDSRNAVRMKHVVIYTDSRGRGLKEHIGTEFNNNDVQTTIVKKSGARLAELILEAEGALNRNKHIVYLVISAGICDLTSRVSGEVRMLRYIRNQEKIDSLKNQISELYRKFPNRINIATIYPASLQNYHHHHNRSESIIENKEEQDSLISDIAELNSVIVKCNIETSKQSINLSGLFMRSSIKKKEKKRVTKLNHSYLPDGVHPSEEAKEKCFDRFKTVLKPELTRRLLALRGEEHLQEGKRTQDPMEDSTESENEETWDFKKKRAKKI